MRFDVVDMGSFPSANITKTPLKVNEDGLKKKQEFLGSISSKKII
ncbi:MAG TPA: hypothetical protein PK754_01005 [bacterium]|nr:hypothetical protein [bacterium]